MRPRSASTDADLARFCALAGPDPLTPEIVRRHAPDASWILDDRGAPAARCSLWWRAAPRLGEARVGLVGHYAARDAAASALLLGAACAQLREAGCDLAAAPVDGSTWRRYRVLTWRGADPPFFLEPDNPDDWPSHFDAAGFAPLATYYSAKCDDLAAYAADDTLAATLGAAGYRSRALDAARVGDELALMWRIAGRAFAGSLLYTTIGEDEFRQTYAPAIAYVRPDLMRVVLHGDEPVAFLFAVPDMLQAARGEAVDRVILKTIAVLPQHQGRGLGKWIVDDTLVRARGAGFRCAIVALMHEANPSRKLGRGRMRDMRRYTLYARAP